MSKPDVSLETLSLLVSLSEAHAAALEHMKITARHQIILGEAVHVLLSKIGEAHRNPPVYKLCEELKAATAALKKSMES